MSTDLVDLIARTLNVFVAVRTQAGFTRPKDSGKVTVTPGFEPPDAWPTYHWIRDVHVPDGFAIVLSSGVRHSTGYSRHNVERAVDMQMIYVGVPGADVSHLLSVGVNRHLSTNYMLATALVLAGCPGSVQIHQNRGSSSRVPAELRSFHVHVDDGPRDAQRIPLKLIDNGGGFYHYADLPVKDCGLDLVTGQYGLTTATQWFMMPGMVTTSLLAPITRYERDLVVNRVLARDPHEADDPANDGRAPPLSYVYDAPAARARKGAVAADRLAIMLGEDRTLKRRLRHFK